MEIVAGTLVTPNVRLVKLLGQGGMGSVWIADHLSLETQVAVKFISEELVKSDATIVERFNREAALSARIKSPHVVQIFDHGVIADGPPYIVMELLEGETLEQLLERVSPLAVDQTVAIVAQTAKALNKAHKLGIVHRDIKPDNIFLVADEDDLHVKVLDFGIAKQTGMAAAKSVTSTGAMIGTPEYMSPEQVLSAKGVDATTDLWALAVVAYRCLTGRVPFSGETLGSLCVAIANNPPTPACELRPTLSPAADAWFAKALAKERGDRYRSAKDLAFAFAAALAPHSVGMMDDFSSPGLVSAADWSGAHQAITITGADPLDGDPGPREAAPTFPGTSATPAPAHSRRRVFALLAAVVLAAAAVAVVLAAGRDGDRSGAAASVPGSAEQSGSTTTSADSPPDSQTSPTHSSAPTTAAGASATASVSNTATVSAPARRRRPPAHHTAPRRPGAATSTAPGSKDRGF